MRRRRVGVLGGTFDPIHVGHLAAARAAERALDLGEVRFVPSHIPPHRAERPAASRYHRFAMISLATADEDSWLASDVELDREGPSFTFDTLSVLHDQGLDPSQIFFITGADAFAEIATWSRYPQVLDAAHFVVVRRQGTSPDTLRARLPELRGRMIAADDLGTGPETRIVLIEADTPAVSSTEIRGRAHTGAPLTSLVPERVAVYITRHHLYGRRACDRR
jgi:nicotinate-nucleotide adenylyltransferase